MNIIIVFHTGKINYNTLKQLMKLMLLYAGLPFANVELDVFITRYDTQREYAGEYTDFSSINKKITLNIERTYSLNVITSILAHEISHYFLKVHNIRLQNKMQNEKLTDTTAIYLGFSKYLLDGYKKFETISGNSNTRRYTKIGYLEIIDIKYIIYKLNKIKHGYNDS